MEIDKGPSREGRHIYSQADFRLRFLEEWRRSERSRQSKLLVLIRGLNHQDEREHVLRRAEHVFRETDIVGWYHAHAALGILLVELGGSDARQALEAVRDKIRTQILEPMNGRGTEIQVEFYVLPHSSAQDGTLTRSDVFDALWTEANLTERMLQCAKRAMDICGSLCLLIVLSPLFVLIALCIRITSPGPALFRQRRVGFRGQTFSFYKFRTMTIGCDDQAHREYVSRFINGKAEDHVDGNGQVVYKMTNDQRVTSLGRILRRTSLDELPQFWNVLRGEMSMVGPRPPLPYEVAQYDLWHLRRVYDLKPGVTGLWQVRGRSRCSFDEMIRMDLQHARPHSLRLYLQVLLQTPHAVLHGNGAH